MKKLLAVLAALAVAVLALAGCGSDKQAASETKVLKVGATAVPHAEVLEQIGRAHV